MKEIEIIKPDDWHVHFRDNEILKAVVPETTRHFARSIVMPNLIPPIINPKQAVEYKKRIKKAIPKTDNFEPLMAVYLTENTNKNELKSGYENGAIFAVKLYPAGATTNSDSGVKDIEKVMPVFETMEEIGMPLLIHGEVTDKEIDIFDREKVFIDKHLIPICKKFPNLQITLEHITTSEAVSFVKEGNTNIRASITPHHLALNRNAIFDSGIRPHYYCLPILKREKHRQALLEAATSGKNKFFLGTDTAPHLITDKEAECGCAGVFNSSYTIPILAEIFEKSGKINNLEQFVSINGAKQYKQKINKNRIKLSKLSKPIKFREFLKLGKKKIKIFNPQFPVHWTIIDKSENCV